MSSQNDRLRELRATADEQDAQRRIVRNFSEAEKEAMRLEATDTMLKLQLHNEHIKEYKEERVKPLQNSLKITLAKLRTGSQDENMTVQGIINAADATMEYFDSEGVMVDVRMLTLDERSQLPFPRQGQHIQTVNHGFEDRTGMQ